MLKRGIGPESAACIANSYRYTIATAPVNLFSIQHLTKPVSSRLAFKSVPDPFLTRGGHKTASIVKSITRIRTCYKVTEQQRLLHHPSSVTIPFLPPSRRPASPVKSPPSRAPPVPAPISRLPSTTPLPYKPRLPPRFRLHVYSTSPLGPPLSTTPLHIQTPPPSEVPPLIPSPLGPTPSSHLSPPPLDHAPSV